MLSVRKTAKYGTLTMWAENGKIHIEDAADGSLTVVGIRDALLRAQALSNMDRKFADDRERAWYNRELRQGVVEDVIDLCRIAKEQREQLVCDDVLPRMVLVPSHISVTEPSPKKVISTC